MLKMNKLRTKSLIFPLLLVCYEIATYLSNDMYLPALPEMMSELGLTLKQAQFTLTLWFFGGAVMPLVMGPVSDRYGRRSVLLCGGLIYIAATVICALTSNPNILLICRFVQGSMVASMMVPGYACIHEMYEKREAIRLLALMGSISVLAPAFGPLLGGIILLITSWRGIFWFIALWTIIVISLLSVWMPETLTREQRQPINFNNMISNYRRVILNKNFMLVMMVLGFNFAGFIAWITAGPVLVINYFKYSAICFGIIQALVFGVYILGNSLVKYLLDKVGVNFLICSGVIICLLGGIAIITFSYLTPNSLFAFVSAMMVYSFGSGLCFSPLNRSVIEQSNESMGIRVAIFGVCLTTFGTLGSGVTSIIFDGSTIMLASVVAVSAILSALFMYVCRHAIIQ